MTRTIALALGALLTGCTSIGPTSPQDVFFAKLQSYCGQSLAGRLVSDDPQDRAMAGQAMTARFGPCARDEVRIGFAVGSDESRNWVVTRTDRGLRLKHVHRHSDGSEDAVSRYGGDTAGQGTAWRQTFPADPFSKRLFVEQGLPQSIPNVWAMEAGGRTAFAYELRRPGRFFRVEFDQPAPR